MEIVFIGNNNEIMELPVVTQVGEITCATDDEEFKTITGLTLNLIGGKGLREFSYSSFFPSKKYNFVSLFKFKPPQSYINFFERYREKKEPVRVIIYDGYNIILNMLCSYEFSYTLRDRAGDVPYTLNIKEYIDPRLKLGGGIGV